MHPEELASPYLVWIESRGATERGDTVMKALGADHDYRESCVVETLRLAHVVPPILICLPTEDDSDTGTTPIDSTAFQDWNQVWQATARAMTEAIDDGCCPICGTEFEETPRGSSTTPCRCIPVCSDCHLVQSYRTARMLDHALVDGNDEEETLNALKLFSISVPFENN
jgi:hypothetical protein